MIPSSPFQKDSLQEFHESLATTNLARMLWLLLSSTALSMILVAANIISIRQPDFAFWQSVDVTGSIVFLVLFILGLRKMLPKPLVMMLGPAYFAFWLILMDGYYFNALGHYGETATYALGTITPAVLIICSPRIVLSLLVPNSTLR